MSLREMQTVLELGLAYAVMALGVYIPFRVLNQTDLTIEGSFTFGAAACAVCTAAGHPLLGLLTGFLCGVLAGLVTGLLQTVFRVAPVLSGILTMTALYSVNLMVMGGRSMIPLITEDTLFTPFSAWVPSGWFRVLPLLCFSLLVLCLLNVFFRTNLGLSIRATGDNERMVRSSSVSTTVTRCVALSLGNALVGLSGGLVAQMQQFADITMGMGSVVVALAALILGEVLFRGGSVLRGTCAALIGSVLYRLIVALVLKLHIPAQAVKAISALVVMLAVCFPVVREKVSLLRRKGGARRAGV